jgi:hypothetical protein
MVKRAGTPSQGWSTFAHLVDVQVTIIDRCDCTDLATKLYLTQFVIEQALDDMRR